MFKPQINQAFLASSLAKAIQPFSTTALTMQLLKAAANAGSVLMASLTLSPAAFTHTTHMRRSSAFAPVTLWTAISLLCVSLLSYSTHTMVVSAAPAKHSLAPKNLINAMGFQVSETSPLPLQLQLEAHVAGTQKLAYVPTSGPSMDFYYLNYRPSYKAGESTIDFWMITPKGTQPPKTASLELYDEFGKIRLATVVQPGTDVPTSKASQGLPFLWKSWRVPLSLDASFDFSEKFRVVLKISDSNHHKRAMEEVNRDIFFAVKSKNKHLTSANNARTVDSPFSPFNSDGIPGSVIIQDRQFRIKGLKATPGGQPNPTKISSVAQPSIPKASAESSAPTTNSETEEVTVDHTMGKLSSALSIGTSLSVTFILAVLVMGSISTVV